jgi:3-oxoacyl-[acyl-carrier protein] reductase
MGMLLGPHALSIIEATPLGRLGHPEDIASVAYFLLSDQSNFMTGQTLAVSGGRVMLP